MFCSSYTGHFFREIDIPITLWVHQAHNVGQCGGHQHISNHSVQRPLPANQDKLNNRHLQKIPIHDCGRAGLTFSMARKDVMYDTWCWYTINWKIRILVLETF